MTFTIWQVTLGRSLMLMANRELCEWFCLYPGYGYNSVILTFDGVLPPNVLSPRVYDAIGCFFVLPSLEQRGEFIKQFFPEGLPAMTIASHDGDFHVWALGEPQYRLEGLNLEGANEWLADLLAAYEQRL